MITNKCSDCGKPLQYCECKMTWGRLYRNGTALEDYLSVDDWSQVKITASVYNPHANIAPITEFEYFQQIGDE